MATLTLLFQAGYQRDSVEIRVDGERHLVTNLDTDYSTGLARKLVLQPQGNTAQVQFECCNDQSKVELTLPADADQFVLIDLDEKKNLQVEVTQHAPVYF